MKPEHRKALITLAADRGEKGFSGVLAEVIEEYLRGEQKRAERKRKLLDLGGSLSDEEAEGLRRVTEDLRNHWR